MFTLKELREKRQAKIDEAQGIVDAVNQRAPEARSLTTDEKTKYDNLDKEIDDLDADIKRAEKAEARAAEQAGRTKPLNNHNTTEKRDLAKFSLSKMCLGVIENRSQTGLEAEMSQEAQVEARNLGLTLQGTAHIPSFLAFAQQRDNSVTMPTQPADGSAIVYDEPAQPMLGLLRPQLAMTALGARTLTGLVGDLPLPGMTQGAKASWKGEIEPLTKSNIKFNNAKAKPHRIGTYIDVSKQFLIQTSRGTDQMLKDDMSLALSQELDRAAIYGTGTEEDNEPLGLLNMPGVYIIAGGTNGRIPTYKDVIALEAAPAIINAGASNKNGYLMNNKIKGTLKTTQIVDGQALMVLMNNTELNGAKLVVTNLIADQQRGSSANASAIVYGADWSNVILCQWGGLDLTVDNLTLALTGQNRIIIQSFWDVAIRRANTFAALVGAIPSAEIAALAPQA